MPDDPTLSDDDAKRLANRLKAHGSPSHVRSFGTVLITAAGFGLLWLLMWLSLDYGYWFTLLLAVPTAGFLLRLFVLMHDCGHGSLFRTRFLNDMVGRVLGTIAMTPYNYWRSAHAVHHATSGSLDRRGTGDVSTMTVREYLASSRLGRFGYRLYRHPLVLFGIGPAYVFIIKQRLPCDLPLKRKDLWTSVIATNIAIVALTVAMAVAIGVVELLMIQLPIIIMASSAGVWLFFVQHQYEESYWEWDSNWSFYQAALRGSSYYSLPKVLQWFSANIGLHHIHHLCSRIPHYRLQECMDRFPELHQVRRLNLWESLKCARLTLWDEETGRMIGFRDVR